MRRIPLLVLLPLLSLPGLLRAQSEEDAVRAVVDRLFDAMRAGDSAAFRATLDPRARLVSVGETQGQPALTFEESLEGFVNAVGTPHEEVWDERIDDVEVRVDDRLAVLTARYAFYRGDRFSHCGIDVFQLYKDPEHGWRIFEIADTRRREVCDTMPDGGAQR